MDAPSKVLWLDLEDTVIDDWFSGVFLFDRMDKIKHRFNDVQFDCMGLFSWAVLDKDVAQFDREFRPKLEQFFGLKFHPDLLVTVERAKLLMCRARNVNPSTVDLATFFDFWADKTSCFHTLMMKLAPLHDMTEMVLFDDTVEDTNMVARLNHNDVNIRTVNVLRL